jgi:hypothetical protein
MLDNEIKCTYILSSKYQNPLRGLDIFHYRSPYFHEKKFKHPFIVLSPTWVPSIHRRSRFYFILFWYSSALTFWACGQVGHGNWSNFREKRRRKVGILDTTTKQIRTSSKQVIVTISCSRKYRYLLVHQTQFQYTILTNNIYINNYSE